MHDQFPALDNPVFALLATGPVGIGALSNCMAVNHSIQAGRHSSGRRVSITKINRDVACKSFTAIVFKESFLRQLQANWQMIAIAIQIVGGWF